MMLARFQRRLRSRPKTMLLAGSVVLLPVAFLLQSSGAQAPRQKTASLSDIQQELVRTETGFFEAWKTNDEAYSRAHMPEEGIFWGESGTFSREQQLQQQQALSKVCKVDGYGLSDFGLLPLDAGAYLLTYRAEQYATCNGERIPVHINGSSVYVLRSGHWQAIYRAQVANLVP